MVVARSPTAGGGSTGLESRLVRRLVALEASDISNVVTVTAERPVGLGLSALMC